MILFGVQVEIHNTLVADLFLVCYNKNFMLSLSDNNQADATEALHTTSRYLDDLPDI